MNRTLSFVVVFMTGCALGVIAGRLFWPPARTPAESTLRPATIELSQFFQAVDPDRLFRVCTRLGCGRGMYSSSGSHGHGIESKDGQKYYVKDFQLNLAPMRMQDGRERLARADVLRGIRAELEDVLALKSARIDGPVRESSDHDGVTGFILSYTPGAAGDPAFVRGEIEVKSESTADKLVVSGQIREPRR